jgi:penicillin-binding protein 2
VALVFTFLGGRLAQLQLLQGKSYGELAEGNRVRLVPLQAARGAIYDRKGEQLVTSRAAYSVSLMVMNKNVAKATAVKLAQILGIDKDDVINKIDKNSGRLYEPIRIASDISPQVHTSIEENRVDLPGVVIDVEPVREYLVSTVASHILGYTGEIRDSQLTDPKFEGYRMGDIIGQAGIEAQYDRLLRGTDGGRQVEVDYKGRPTPKDLGRIEPEPGNDLYLTLDAGLQRLTEDALITQLEVLRDHKFEDALAGAAVMIDVNTGEILAMVSVPTFDSNEFARGMSTRRFAQLINDPLKPLFNRAIAGTYAPGSTFKMATAIAALEEGKVTPTETFYDPGHHPVVKSLACHLKSGHGYVNMYTALQVSCNVYFYEMGRRLGVDLIAKWGKRMGLGVKSGVDIGGEAQGLMPTTEWKRRAYQTKNPPMREPEFLLAEHMMAGMGQVYHSYTPLQMANYVATIANGGTRYQPHFLSRAVDASGQVVKKFQPVVADRVAASESTMDVVRKGMWLVTKPGGTAFATFAGFPIEVAAKTGTAENTGGEAHAWVVGYAPYQDPKVAFAVLLEHGGHGGTAAAPVARKMLEYYFNIERK